MTCTVLFRTVKVTGAEYFVLPDVDLHHRTVLNWDCMRGVEL